MVIGVDASRACNLFNFIIIVGIYVSRVCNLFNFFIIVRVDVSRYLNLFNCKTVGVDVSTSWHIS